LYVILTLSELTASQRFSFNYGKGQSKLHEWMYSYSRFVSSTWECI